MRRLVPYCACAALFLAVGEARPCGGAFGVNYTLDPSQRIVVSHHAGVETYVFNPRFCGQASSFGLILPVPAALSANPTLGSGALYTDLAKAAAPTIVTQTTCTRGTGGASSGTGGKGGVPPDATTVIDRGQVGIFDWALLQATTVASFTDWLTTNGYPYQSAAASTFQYYVTNGWYFVAFKVSVDPGGAGGNGGGGTSSTTICGNFGPIMLSFPAATSPVVPARIAMLSSSSLQWTIYTLASQRLRLRDYYTTLRFSGVLGATELASYPGVASVAQAGDRLTELFLNTTPNSDLVLEPDPSQADYRSTEYQTVVIACSGGSGSGGAATGGIASGGAATGGIASGGVATGGIASGGAATGGSQADGGTTPALGGNASGGVVTGGIASGGVATGGSQADGGTTPALGGNASGGGGSAAGGSDGGTTPALGGNAGSGAGTPVSGESGCTCRSARTGRVEWRAESRRSWPRS
jgi:hypothetical protein